jgi:hypothetical protein
MAGLGKDLLKKRTNRKWQSKLGLLRIGLQTRRLILFSSCVGNARQTASSPQLLKPGELERDFNTALDMTRLST